MTALPAAFVDRIRNQLGSEAEAFFHSYEEPRTYGLRLHPDKLVREGRTELLPELERQFGLKPIPWCPDGYYYDSEARPGRHPYHAAGLYYIQDPSAMIAAELLDPQPGDHVLDLAAAPGGKTTQIALKLRGQGLLVANEIHPSRAKILSENVERMGIGNTIVTNATPGQLASRWPMAFDRIMLDAPCSGEGMFRKEPDSMAEWSQESVSGCASRQRDILPDAAAMLKPGGRMVYATCTFNREENEETLAWFLDLHPDFRLVKVERLWPHLIEGEGHFAAVLEKLAPEGADDESLRTENAKIRRTRGELSRFASSKSASSSAWAAFKPFEAFMEDTLPGLRLPAGGEPLLFGEALYWYPGQAGSPFSASSLGGLKILRAGLHLGDNRKNRFEPSHALALYASVTMAVRSVDYRADAPEVSAYLRGEVLTADSPHKGWGLLTIDQLPLGWYKASEGQLKNHYPKGLRANR
ncbi:hypothetical protein AXX17_ATUG04360 [Arabidopsis thaliana]|uniref:SAM-dependent MTase RsmB/NOP-type domain-containing protein n=1 Tax=Arabidopsis thaliana TaxID=3702 RepID=A0A178U5E5_ARATH|nr:hypothetical protein AXX17_ATUG04360 [Arabidopsis thaliana]